MSSPQTPVILGLVRVLRKINSTVAVSTGNNSECWKFHIDEFVNARVSALRVPPRPVSSLSLAPKILLPPGFEDFGPAPLHSNSPTTPLKSFTGFFRFFGRGKFYSFGR